MAQSSPFELPPAQELQSEQQRKLLDAIDSLRSQGLSGYTDLPQLIVCGGQSTGKSSVLEALSGVPFPHDANLCTRFASEVVLRREPEQKVGISIVPSPKRSLEQKQKLNSFKRTITSYDEFPSVVKDAESLMGLSDTVMNFAEDILKVEVHGPTQPQLTLVDLPGLFETVIDDQNPEDIEVVNSIVTKYMKNPRSIILAIVQATAHYQTQKVLKKAREIDQSGKRTLGIITKPDGVIKNSNEESVFLGLARNVPIRLKLGWHVVLTLEPEKVKKLLSSKKAKTADPTTSPDRDEQEDVWFQINSNFRSDPSVGLGTGIASLRSRLSKLLLNQISDTIDPLRQEISRGIDQCNLELGKLGEERSDASSQKSFLMNLSNTFRLYCRDAIRGIYEDKFFLKNPSDSLRLCAVLRTKHEGFAEQVKKVGATWEIVKLEDLEVRGRDHPRAPAIQAAIKVLRKHKGSELIGFPTSAAVQALFQAYSASWADLASQHILDCRLTIEEFVTEVLDSLADKDVSERIRDYLFEDVLTLQLQNAQAELRKLLAVHQKPPFTTNPRFQKILRESGVAKKDDENVDPFEVRLKMQPSDQSGDVPAEIQAAVDALNRMRAYYEIASDLFIDNVPTLAIWSTMVYELEESFTPQKIESLGPDRIQAIARESRSTILRRQELKMKLEALNKGRDECDKHLLKSALARNVAHRPRNNDADPKLSNTPTPGSAQSKGLFFENPPNPKGFVDFFGKGSKSKPFEPAASNIGGKASLFNGSLQTTSLFGTPNQLTKNEQPSSSRPTSASASSTVPASVFGTFAAPARTPSPAPPSSLNPTIPSKTTTNQPLFGFGTNTNRASVSTTTYVKSASSAKQRIYQPKLSGPAWHSLCGGTAHKPFVPQPVEERSNGEPDPCLFQSISAQSTYRDFSHEELRLADYERGRYYGIVK